MPSKIWIIIFSFQLFFCCVFSQLRWVSGVSVALILIIAKGNILQYQHDHLFQFGQNITITGKVDSFFKENNFGFRGRIEVYQVNDYQFPCYLRPRILLYVPNGLKLHDKIHVEAKLKSIVGLKNEAGFDAENYYFSRDIIAKAFARKVANKFQDDASGYHLRSWLYEHFLDKTNNLKNQGLARAISFADRSGLTKTDWNYLKTSGLAHLVAISGLHIGIAYLIGYGIGGIVIRFGKISLWFPAFLGFLTAFIYAWLAGFSVTTSRALVMVAINVVLSMTRVKVVASYRLLLTLSLTLCYAPFALFSSSFWLSFIAVTLVFINGHSTQRYQMKLTRLIVANLFMALVMMPVSAWFFGGISLLSGLYNFIFIPLFTFFIVPLLFLLLLMTALQVSQFGLLWTVWDHLLGFVPYFSTLSEDYWVPVSSVLTLFMICVSLVFFVRGMLGVKSFSLMLLTVFLIFECRHEPDSMWTLDVLDVGQGSAMILQKNGHYLLYDTGKSWPGGSIAESVISPVLSGRGVKKLDGLIISHVDNDHAGGEQSIVKKWGPDWILSSRKETTDRQCIAGEQWRWQGLILKVIWPEERILVPRNAHSCAIRISDEDGHSVLMTGDIMKKNEWEIVSKVSPLQSTILIVPHHGSGSSSSEDFVKATHPEYAIASLARDNPWSFPKKQVVEKYHKMNAIWLDTGHTGQIHITFFSDNYQIVTMRNVKGEQWYRQMLRKKVE
ncbi:DNA internalization-related competence protein ComEC/Rec2 [Vibrio sp. DNF-1]|nr:DNA internalization-related competence protein ComEC/Rec2 [Vibrio salinus]